MRYPRLAIPACALVLFGAPEETRAGAWLQPEGTAYLRLTAGVLSTDRRYDETGSLVPWDTSGGGFRNAEYRDLESILYAEIGFDNDWNVVAMTSWKHLEAQQPSATFRTWGLSDLSIGFKRRLWTGPRAVTSFLTALTLPTGYDKTEYPALGSGVTDLSFIGMAGTSGNAFWATLEIEYRLRGGDFRNQVKGAFGGGWNLSERFGLRAEARGGIAVGEERPPGADPRFDPAKADPSNLDLAATASYRLGRGIALEAEARSTVTGRNTLSGTRWSVALATSPSWRWRR